MNISEYLERDHDRLDAIVDEVRRLSSTGATADARARFAEMAAGLDKHIDVEEQILFPTFEGATGMKGGPTTVMRREHVEIRRLLDATTTALASGAAVEAALDALVDILGTHNQKEEHVLYPMTDRAIDDDEREQVLGRMRAILG